MTLRIWRSASGLSMFDLYRMPGDLRSAGAELLGGDFTGDPGSDCGWST
jgi:hypothetical protein